MDKEFFNKQIGRLIECFTERHYPMPRITAMYTSLRRFRHDELEGAITELINGSRSAPLLPQILDAIENLRHRNKQQPRSNADLLQTLKNMENPENQCPTEHKDLCVQILKDKLAGKLSPAAWKEACEYMEKVEKFKQANDAKEDPSQGGPHIA